MDTVINSPTPEPCGILCIDKPSGITSHDVVSKIRRLYGTRKVGHTGTLDPMATGLLVLLLGRATKLSDFLLSGGKEYLAGLRLGIVTDTEDITGTVLSRSDLLPDRSAVEAALRSFVGKSIQIPPMYSAKKIGGRKLYDLARQGVEVERAGCEIEIERISLEASECTDPESSPMSEPPTDRSTDCDYRFDVVCSKGTYIRTLCHDIGQKLGCGGAMSSLRRLRNGTFSIDDAITLDRLETMPPSQRLELLRPIESALADCPKVILPDFFAALASHGCEIYQKKIGTDFPEGTLVRIYRGSVCFALGEVRTFPDGTAIKPVRQF